MANKRKETSRGELITQAVRELDGIERAFERRTRNLRNAAEIAAVREGEIETRVQEWLARWGERLTAAELKDAIAFAKSSVPAGINPARPSRTGAAIRDGQVYGAKVPRAQGQARPRRKPGGGGA